VCHNRWHPYKLLKIGLYIHIGVDLRQRTHCRWTSWHHMQLPFNTHARPIAQLSVRDCDLMEEPYKPLVPFLL